MNTINDRIRGIIDDLFDGSVRAFSIAIGQNYYTIRNITGERASKPSSEILQSIVSSIGNIDSDWLLTGKGDMLRSSTANRNYDIYDYGQNETQGGRVAEDDEPYIVTKAGVKYYQLPNGKYIMRVPFVPMKAYAKYVDECRDAEYSETLEEYNFVVDQIGHGRYMAFEIKGDSMDDNSKRSLSSGDIILGRELGKEHWRDRLRTNEYPNWIIVLDNTILCKQIINQDVERGTITCHSLNPSPEYSDFELKFNDIRQMFNIIQRVSSMA